MLLRGLNTLMRPMDVGRWDWLYSLALMSDLSGIVLVGSWIVTCCHFVIQAKEWKDLKISPRICTDEWNLYSWQAVGGKGDSGGKERKDGRVETQILYCV